MMKCGRCKIVKEFEHFSKNKAQKNGLQNRCKQCHKEDRHTIRTPRLKVVKAPRFTTRDELLQYIHVDPITDTMYLKTDLLAPLCDYVVSVGRLKYKTIDLYFLWRFNRMPAARMIRKNAKNKHFYNNIKFA